MPQKLYPYACLNIDCSWADWLRALQRALYTSETSAELLPKISRLFSHEGNVIITLCVRTAFDLYLQALSLPIGSEVIMSAINIPEMVRIVRKYGLIPVPVDIDVETLSTTSERVENAITKRTGLIVIAMTFGSRYSLEAIAKVALKHEIPLFEDCAEAYCGKSFKGDSYADASVFSFGPIKTATAFQGGIMIIRRDPELLSKIQSIHGSYPIQSSKVFLKKILKYSSGMVLLNSKKINGLVRPLMTKFNYDYKKGVVGLMRGFPTGQGLEVYRVRPCTAMLSFLYRRLITFNEEKFKNANKNIQEGTDILSSAGIIVPGYKHDNRTYWLYPIVAENTLRAYKDLNNSGIDAYKGITQLNCIDPPVGDSFSHPKIAQGMFEKLVYLPIHKDVPLKDIKDICRQTVSLLRPRL